MEIKRVSARPSQKAPAERMVFAGCECSSQWNMINWQTSSRAAITDPL
jgi:hypothetical protein